MRVRVGAATDRGRVREQNEDVYMLRPDRGLFIVCDGMGGVPGGEVASQIAAQAILDHLDRTPRPVGAPLNADGGYLPQTHRLAEAVRASNRAIYDRRQHDSRHAEMGTTVVGAWLQHHTASVAHVGDSRAYLWHNHRLVALTRDHSLLEAFASLGVSDRAHDLHPDPQNTLFRVLGAEPDVDVDLQEVVVQSGDYLLLCSDGFTRMVPEATLRQAISRLSDPQRICDYLIDIANRNGGTDNITVVVVEVVGGWWRRLLNTWKHSAIRGQRAEAHSEV